MKFEMFDRFAALYFSRTLYELVKLVWIEKLCKFKSALVAKNPGNQSVPYESLYGGI